MAGACLAGYGTALASDIVPEANRIHRSTKDSVIVQSRTIAPGATNAVIGIRIVNTMPVMGLTVPLEFRAVTPGAFVTKVALGFSERLTFAL